MPEEWARGPAPSGGEGEPPAPPEDDLARCTRRRDNARWTAAVGFLTLFVGGRFLAAFLVGGMLMAAYGVAASFYWSRRMRKIKGDPWAYDPELDGPRFER